MNFSKRSYQKELLDRDSIPFADIRQNMKELDLINKWLGGHAITISGFKKLAGNKKSVSICEIGCGGGDNLLAIDRWCTRRGISLSLTGIDLKKECIDFASSRYYSSPVKWITSDYRNVILQTKPDILFSSLFCHHFEEEQLVRQFQWMKDNSLIGFFINDLQRHPLAYYSIKILTAVFSRSYLVRNDAPVSVTRGFNRGELRLICVKAGIRSPVVLWKWAFRYLVIVEHER